MKKEDLMCISPYVRGTRCETLAYKYAQYLDYDHCFMYIIDGVMEYKVDGVDYRLSAGNGLLTPPFCPHFAYAPQPVTMCVIHFDFYTDPRRIPLEITGAQEYFQSVPPEILHPQREMVITKPNFYTFESVDCIYIRNKVEKIVTLHKDPANFLKVKSEMIKLIDILCNSDVSSADIVKKNLSSWPTVMSAVDYIEGNYQNPELSNEDIYSATGASKSYLSTVFKSSTGLSLHQYLLNVRITRAKELLARGYTATAAASSVGFTSLHSFIRAFKQIANMTPSEYMSLTV